MMRSLLHVICPRALIGLSQFGMQYEVKTYWAVTNLLENLRREVIGAVTTLHAIEERDLLELP
jgi:hypothetical protein